MEATGATEKHVQRETAVQRLARHTGSFFVSFGRLAALTLVLLPIFLVSFLSLDIPMRAFDGLFGGNIEARPSSWLSRGAFIMLFAPMMVILVARKYGGDEASRAITAAWGVAAIAVFAELSYLAPTLEAGDLPGARFVVVFVGAAMAAQYIAANVYDVARGGDNWWRAPLYGVLSGYMVHALIYFPSMYWGSGVPWLNWIVIATALSLGLSLVFLPIYFMMRRSLRPKGGFGGR